MHPVFRLRMVALAALVICLGGCTSFNDYVHNGFKVGPNYCTPPAPVAQHWIDSNDVRVRSKTDDLSTWWTVLDDPLLNQLVVTAYRQNLTLRQAGFQVLEARAQRNIIVGQLFPQTQDANGSYQRIGVAPLFYDQWNSNFNLQWEVDFWGRFRRAVASADDTLDASVFNYDDVLVTLLGDIASDYVLIRTYQERIRLLVRLVDVQQGVYDFIDQRLRLGHQGITDLDKAQAYSNLEASKAQINELAVAQRQTENALCTLLGVPTQSLRDMLDKAPKTTSPKPPDYLVAGIPADLLRRRPDVRRAERQAAAQAEQIGIAQSDFYPAMSINGTLGWEASHFGDLFRSKSLVASTGPSFQWNLLNYGRILNNVRLQDATFKQLVAAYQAAVLNADTDVENGIVEFLQEQERIQSLKESVDASYVALFVIVRQYEAGLAGVDFNRYAVILQNLITQQDLWAQARGEENQGLIQVYRALGGGWQIRLNPQAQAHGPGAPEAIPMPAPENLPAPKEAPKDAPKDAPQPAPNPLPNPAPIPVPPKAEPMLNPPAK